MKKIKFVARPDEIEIILPPEFAEISILLNPMDLTNRGLVGSIVDFEEDEEISDYYRFASKIQKDLREYLVRLGFPQVVADDIEVGDREYDSFDTTHGFLFGAYVIRMVLNSKVKNKITIPGILELAARETEIIPHVPELFSVDFLNRSKSDIIKWCLYQFKHDRYNGAENAMTIVRTLREKGLDWPEFDAMEKSYKSTKSGK